MITSNSGPISYYRSEDRAQAYKAHRDKDYERDVNLIKLNKVKNVKKGTGLVGGVKDFNACLDLVLEMAVRYGLIFSKPEKNADVHFKFKAGNDYSMHGKQSHQRVDVQSSIEVGSEAPKAKSSSKKKVGKKPAAKSGKMDKKAMKYVLLALQVGNQVNAEVAILKGSDISAKQLAAALLVSSKEKEVFEMV